MLESERWVALRRLTDGESAPTHELPLTWWQGSRHEVADVPPVPLQAFFKTLEFLTTEPTPFWVAEFTVAGRSLFAEFDRLPDAPRSDLTLVGWPEIGGVVAVEAAGQRVVALPLTHKRPHGLAPCP
jgi:hypothetical protein